MQLTPDSSISSQLSKTSSTVDMTEITKIIKEKSPFDTLTDEDLRECQCMCGMLI